MLQSLQNLKEALFDAPTEVKSAFNDIVRYFDSWTSESFYVVAPGIINPFMVSTPSSLKNHFGAPDIKVGIKFDFGGKERTIVAGPFKSSEDAKREGRKLYKGKSVKSFDFLDTIKSELFDAPAEVKNAFNSIVKYFASSDPKKLGKMYALYLKNSRANTWTISDIGSRIKDIGGIQLSWDPHSGLYFIGALDKLKMLQRITKEETTIEDYNM